MKIVFLFNILTVLMLVQGCAGRKTLAPVSDRTAPSSTKVEYHIVAPGETLYSIAWKYDLDYKNLSLINGIGSDYRIFPGQRIRLKGRPYVVNSSPKTTSSTVKTPSVRPPPKPKVAVKTSSDRLEKKTGGPEAITKKPSAIVWNWPARGRIIRNFNGNGGLNKGIDIKGNLGEPVLAASSGSVVYAGQGLRGYGKLIIIKHSDKYLSAYAHNRRLNVKEGDSVAGGEKIAEMGNSGTNTVKLHFEVRFDGRPVNPLKYLPPK